MRMRDRKVLQLLAVLLGGTPILFGGCDSAEEFRSVAGSSIQSGITSIATGLIDGAFAVFEPDSTSDNSSN